MFVVGMFIYVWVPTEAIRRLWITWIIGGSMSRDSPLEEQLRLLIAELSLYPTKGFQFSWIYI